MEIGKRIRELREERGLTQREVARRAGLTPSGVGFIENGQTQNPSAETVVAVARALGVPVEELLREPASVGKGDAPLEQGRFDLEQRGDYDFREARDAMLQFCERCRERLASKNLTMEELDMFLDALEGFSPTIAAASEAELRQLEDDHSGEPVLGREVLWEGVSQLVAVAGEVIVIYRERFGGNRVVDLPLRKAG